MNGNKIDGRLGGRAFASAVLLEKVVRDAYDKRRSSEVQPLQWSILRYLSMATEERSTIRWIASFLGLTHAPVVRAVKTLQQRDYVLQQPNPSDRRSTIVRLSERGRAQLNEDPLLAVAARIEMMAEEERHALISSIRGLLSEQEGGEGSGDGVNPAS